MRRNHALSCSLVHMQGPSSNYLISENPGQAMLKALRPITTITATLLEPRGQHSMRVWDRYGMWHRDDI